jgi:glycosyltransferase involved in cell wall biosynthesis
MAVGLPCIATDCTGVAELLDDGRGYLVDYRFTHRDPFGNGFRYWIDVDKGVKGLELAYKVRPEGQAEDAREYVEERTWDIAVDTVEKSLLEILE